MEWCVCGVGGGVVMKYLSERIEFRRFNIFLDTYSVFSAESLSCQRASIGCCDPPTRDPSEAAASDTCLLNTCFFLQHWPFSGRRWNVRFCFFVNFAPLLHLAAFRWAVLLLIALLHQSIFKRKLHHSRSINGDTEETYTD